MNQSAEFCNRLLVCLCLYNAFVLFCLQILYNGQPIVKVACGAEFSMVVDCKGNIYSFGCPEYGQLGNVLIFKELLLLLLYSGFF